MDCASPNILAHLFLVLIVSGINPFVIATGVWAERRGGSLSMCQGRDEYGLSKL